jgi:hypothetical protein
LDEELALSINPGKPIYLGRFTAEAANEPGFLVEAELFQMSVDAEVRPQCEIEELVWASASAARDLPLARISHR